MSDILVRDGAIIYIDKDVPQTNEIVKDLVNLGYEKYMAERLGYYSNKKIIKLKKEEVIGQGILDAQKALRGLGVLDANRLNLKDIQALKDGVM